MGILDALAWLDNKRRVAANNITGLLTDGGDTARQLAAQTGEDLSGQARGLLNASSVMHDPSATSQQKRAAFNDMLPGLLGMVTVYHGTPHTFDRYDLSKIGTGEGAQAYGHGIYFAENPNVAEAYQRGLARHEMADASGKTVWNPDYNALSKTGPITPEDRAALALQYAFDAQSSAPYQLAASLVRRTENQADIAPTWDVLAKWQEAGVVPKARGAVYQQDLPDEVLPRMLQWDKPLSEQPEAVRQFANQHWYGDPSPRLTGEDIYNALGYVSPDRNAAEWAKLGVPGVSYLDAGSRGAGSGTLNHVIWDQDLLNRMIPQPMP